MARSVATVRPSAFPWAFYPRDPSPEGAAKARPPLIFADFITKEENNTEKG